MDKDRVKVLLIEDDEDDYMLTHDWFEEIDGTPFTLDWVKSYEQALNAIRAAQHDVYLIDYRLGMHTGLELLRQAKLEGCAAPLIILTGHGDRQIDIEAGRMGAADYLIKDEISASILERTIRYALERKRAEDALQQSEERYRNLFSHTPVSICEEDFSDVEAWLARVRASGVSDLTLYLQTHAEMVSQAARLVRIHDVNDASYALLKASGLTEMVGGLHYLFQTAAQSFLVEQLQAVWNGVSEVEQEVSIYTLSGEPIQCVLLWAVPTNDDRRDLSNTILVMVDITQRLQTERALAQAQKLESLGLLTGGVAHDFNNLLVAMMGQTSLALAHLPPGDLARESIEKAVKATRRAADLVRQMLAYSGRGLLETRPIQLNSLIRENLHLFTATLPKHIQLKEALHATLPMIEGDPTQMQQVIMNLLLNSVDAIGKSPGTVSIITDLHKARPNDDRFSKYTGLPLRPAVYVKLIVEDDGCGIEAETLAKIFDPFFTTKFSGHGLGLAAVLGIVRGHKGGMQVQSKPGQGTTFTILFPALSNTYESDPVQIAPQVTVPVYGTILVIDDEEPVREAITDILQVQGWRQVLTAAKGTLGIALYREHIQEIRLVVLDLSMPHMSGEEVFRTLREIDPHVPVLLSSGYHELEAMRNFSDTRHVRFIQKPYDAETLVAKIHSFLASIEDRTH